MTSKWRLIVPTYMRKFPLILSMLERDESLEIYFAVRSELYDDGFYKDLEAIDRVHIIPIGYGLTELGETREAIMNYCRDNNIEYCCMFDDGITNLVNIVDSSFTISEVIEHCINQIERDEMKDLIVGFSMHKRYGLRNDGSIVDVPDSSAKDSERYFVAFPTQAVILNMKVVNNYDLHYKSLKEVGFEDGAFFADAIKAGLVYAGDKVIKIDGIIPNMQKPGGSHSATDNLELKYDIQNQRCLDYTGRMLGASLEKRYRSYANGLLSLIIWNLDYYREVLCYNREANKVIIDNKFII